MKKDVWYWVSLMLMCIGAYTIANWIFKWMEL